MRIHLLTTKNNQVIPFNYQSLLTNALHKWLGYNNFHDEMSFYSFSWLNGGNVTKEGLNFKDGARFFISANDPEFIKQILKGIQHDSIIAMGLSVIEVTIQENPKFDGDDVVMLFASPVLVKRRINDKEVHFTYQDDESGIYLTETMKSKLEKAGLSNEGVSITFDKNYHSPLTKVIYYNKIGNKVSLCPLKISGSPEQKAFAWNVGVGNSTGIGFGAIK
ncbi:MAG: CRISPR-associated endoribonuclease Cas6 [Balneolales bacterium]